MVKQSRTDRSIGRTWALAVIVALAASSALALRGGPQDRRQVRRLVEMRVMDIFAQNYGETEWSRVTSDLVAHPGSAANPAVIPIFLSLGNVYLNRYERGHDETDLDRSLQWFEWVAANRDLWGGREGSGSVVSYLDISLSRLESECDVGAFQPRIDSLWSVAMAITAEEADGLLAAVGLESILPVLAEDDASRASLLAAAASFLADDPRASAWAQSAQRFAAGFKASECRTSETALALSQGALSYRLVGREIPGEFAAVSSLGVFRQSSDCSPNVRGYQTGGPIAVVTPGASLDLAMHDAEVVSFCLTEVYLWQFPPGSQCGDGDDGEPVDVNLH